MDSIYLFIHSFIILHSFINFSGALNLTRKARKESQDAEDAAIRASEDHLVNAERQVSVKLVMPRPRHIRLRSAIIFLS